MSTSAIERRGPSHPEGMRGVNVGSGPKNLLPVWWNVDLRPFEGINQAMDATEPWPWGLPYINPPLSLRCLEGSRYFPVVAWRILCVHYVLTRPID